jgi:hypothetical protein
MEFIQGQDQEPTQEQRAATTVGANQAEMIPAGQQQPMGAAQGTGLANIEGRPQDAPDEPASEEEQAQYQDLFLRAMAAINDIRKPPKGGTGKSLADQTIQSLADKNAEPQEAIGRTAANLMINMITMAKRQQVEYSPDVVREVGMDMVGELYMIAGKSGAIKNLPEEESDEGEAILHHAVIEATKVYGEHMISTGQTDQQAHMKELQHQMQREGDAGELEDWGMEEFDEESRFQLARKMGDITDGRS